MRAYYKFVQKKPKSIAELASEVITDRRANDHATYKITAWSPDPKRARKLHYRAVLGWLAATDSFRSIFKGLHRDISKGRRKKKTVENRMQEKRNGLKTTSNECIVFVSETR